jgi:osmotically-inducible protein OsmY
VTKGVDRISRSNLRATPIGPAVVISDEMRVASNDAAALELRIPSVAWTPTRDPSHGPDCRVYKLHFTGLTVESESALHAAPREATACGASGTHIARTSDRHSSRCKRSKTEEVGDMKGHGTLLGTLVATSLALAPACRGTAEGVKEDAQQNADKAQQEAQDLKKQSQDTAHKIGEKTEEVSGQVAEGAKGVAEDIKQGAEDIKQGAKNVGKDVKEGAKDFAKDVKEGAKAVASEAGAEKQTVDVKAALMLDKGIDASRIDVDTDADSKTVTLKGSVPTHSQRAAAERVAREHATGYRVHNRLTVLEK